MKFLGEEEACTGDAARRLGEEGLFQQLALQNIATLKRRGVERISDSLRALLPCAEERVSTLRR